MDRGGAHVSEESAALPIEAPGAGLASMRIGLEFGGAADFSATFEHALGKSGGRGATLVALLDRGDLGIHVPHLDGPCWNSVPLFHLVADERPTAQDWMTTSAILEKLERYR
ncbi:hypothetical protein BH20CHL8_BH20CHL8_07100 [soil metagenome]